MRVLVLAVCLLLALHYGWEAAHAPLYRFETGMPLPMFLLLCAIGDLAIGAAAYAGTALGFRRPAWLVQAGWRGPTIAWMLAGLALTIVVELQALARGLWAYRPPMPEIWGIGLSPLLQWLAVPAAVVAVSRALLRRRNNA